MGVLYVGVNVGAEDVEVDVIYISFIVRGVQRLGRAGIRQFRPRGGHQNSTIGG